MTDTINLADFTSFELSPVTVDQENSTFAKTAMVVCSVKEAEEWAIYGRNVDGTVTHLYDGTQATALKIILTANPTAKIVLKTATSSESLPVFTGEPEFAVLPCRIGDNGVLEPIDSECGAEKWGLFAFRSTGIASMSYVQLGQWSNKEAAYFALSAIIYKA